MLNQKSALFSINEEKILQKLNPNSDFQTYFNKSPLTRLNDKTFLEKVLSIIKISQMEILSYVSNCKKNKKFSYQIIKKLLLELKQEFDETIKDNMRTEINLNKSPDKNRFICRKNEISSKKEDINLQKSEIPYEINNNKLNSKLTKLKLLNFKLKNQLSYFDTKITLFSSGKLQRNDSKKFIYLNCKNEQYHAYNLLHDELIDKREKFKLIVKNKKDQNIELLELKNLVNIWKEEVALIKKGIHNDYVITSQIIEEEEEETKEYTDTDNGIKK